MSRSIGARISMDDTTTDRISASVQATLENYRDEIDRDGALRSVFIRVRLDAETGKVKEVTVSRESEFSSR